MKTQRYQKVEMADLVGLVTRLRHLRNTTSWRLATGTGVPQLFGVTERLIAGEKPLAQVIIQCFSAQSGDAACRGVCTISSIDLAVRATAAHAVLARVDEEISWVDRRASAGNPRKSSDLLGEIVRTHKVDQDANLRRCIAGTLQSELVLLIANEAAARLGKGTFDEVVEDGVRRHLSVFARLALATENHQRSLTQSQGRAQQERATAMYMLRGGCGLA